METIKNYLDAMFASIPDSPQARKAKQELYSMMEDKYNELIQSGMPKNEVIGTIISEFGSKEDLMEILDQKKAGIIPSQVKDAPDYENSIGRRLIDSIEADSYIKDVTSSRILLGCGVFFCIIAPIGPILAAGLSEIFILNLFSDFLDAIGVILLFISVALGVALILLSTSRNKLWRFLDNELCMLDPNAEFIVQNELIDNQENKTFMLAGGILLCIVSVVPVIFFGIVSICDFFTDALGPSLIFVLVGAGVFFILNASRRTSACEKLLTLKNRG